MEIVKLGSDILRQKCSPMEVSDIGDNMRSTFAEMFKAMKSAKGIGLAAPQIGVLKRFFVVMADDNVPRVFINPQIVQTSNEVCDYEEGCLSLPNIYETISRPEGVVIQALNEYGKPFTLEAKGLLARVIQHENDHLNGVLFIDKGSPEFARKAAMIMERREKKALEKKKKHEAKVSKIARKVAAKLQAKLDKKERS